MKRLNNTITVTQLVSGEPRVTPGSLDQHLQCAPSYYVVPEVLLGLDDAIREGFSVVAPSRAAA